MSYTNMAASVVLVAMLFMRASAQDAVTELSCSDNATCIDNLTKELVRSLEERKAVRMFDMFEIQPIEPKADEEGRASQGPMARFIDSHALKVDIGDYAVCLKRSNSKHGSIDVDIDEGRGRGNNRRVLQVILPLVLGVKAASGVIVAVAAVALLTFKAFLASKLALLVTLGMVAKKLLDNFGGGVGFQHQPYVYSHYPVDFPSAAAASHGYSLGAVAPISSVGPSGSYSPELYGATALASQTHQHEMLQAAGDAATQQSQASSVQIANVTRASDRWDGLKRKPMSYGSTRATYEHYPHY